MTPQALINFRALLLVSSDLVGAMASGSSLISLFKFACDAWDFIQLYRAYDADYKKLQLQFELEKCRLYTWGSEMGLADNSRPNILDGWHSTALVTACLQQIISMLSDGSGISEKYGCDEMSPATTPLIDQGTTRSGGIATAFDQFKIEVPTRDTHQPNMLRKSKWVVRDRKKFRLLIEEVRGLVDSLCSVTTELSSKSRMEEVLRSRIKAIPDIETLLMIATAWKESYPRIASAASTQAESLSMSSGRQGAIFEWQTMVASEASEGTLIQDLEDLTITELKHSVIRSNQEIESLRNALEETKGHTTIMMSQMTTIDGNAKSQRTSTVVVSAFVLTYVPITFYMVSSPASKPGRINDTELKHA